MLLLHPVCCSGGDGSSFDSSQTWDDQGFEQYLQWCAGRSPGTFFFSDQLMANKTERKLRLG